MQRDHSIIERCKECASVTVALVYEHGIGDDGEPYAAIYRDVVPHSRNDCERMQSLAREAWPTLF